MVFISHANPEDNVFSRWLTLRLAREGYPVWCDLTKLLGGEDFWKDIEHAIRERTAKFIYVLSEASNIKDGTLQELHIAKSVQKIGGIKDFIIPVKIDGLSYSDVNIELARLNTIDFSKSWAHGLAQLFKKLEEDRLSRDPRFSPSTVSQWWRSNFSSKMGLSRTPEEYLSNWFPFEMPSEIQVHGIQRMAIGPLEVDAQNFAYPAYQDGIDLVSFAPAEDVECSLGTTYQIAYTHHLKTADFLADKERGVVNRNIVNYLLKRAWYSMLSKRNDFLSRQMANNVTAFVFKRGFQSSDFVSFTSKDGRRQRRQLVGYKTLLNGSKRYWHFGFDVRPRTWPVTSFVLTSHVLFSDDGFNLWENPKRLHRARRSQCKNWYNDDWRDRLLAAVDYLSMQGSVAIPISSRTSLRVGISPVSFVSGISFSEPDSLNLAPQDTEDVDEEDSTTDWDDLSPEDDSGSDEGATP